MFRTPHPPVMEVLPVAVMDGCCRRRRRNNEVEEPFISTCQCLVFINLCHTMLPGARKRKAKGKAVEHYLS